MASSATATNTAGARQVPCETADSQQIAVEVDVLRLSHTFAKMYDDLGIEEHEKFPGIFPVKNIESRVFLRVIDWCKEHKGQADPIVEKDAFTQVEKLFQFSDFERQFLSVPVPELLELVEAANFLNIRSLRTSLWIFRLLSSSLHVPRYNEQYRNEKTKEQLTIRSSDHSGWTIAVERK